MKGTAVENACRHFSTSRSVSSVACTSGRNRSGSLTSNATSDISSNLWPCSPSTTNTSIYDTQQEVTSQNLFDSFCVIPVTPASASRQQFQVPSNLQVGGVQPATESFQYPALFVCSSSVDLLL